LASSLLGVLAQRLVRKICSECNHQTDVMLPPEIAEVAGGGEGNGRAWEGAGCESCGHSGYRGRSGIYELLVVDDPIRDLILKHASADAVREEAIAQGMRTLREDGALKARDGATTVAELIRVTRD
jgi:type II secretory ATPase GspE/PulE/Tfp pilus assembly ATPase PilB-like protein